MRVSNEEIDLLPLSQYDGEISLISKAKEIPAAIEEMSQCAVLGFDTETRPAFTRGCNYKVALLQLSSEHKTWLFRLCKTGLTAELAQFLERTDIVKPGLAIRDDLRGLCRLTKFTPGGFVDLQTIAAQNGVEDMSLKKMAAHVLGVRVSKRQRLTNWEAETLTQGQMTYAATDSWISLLIYNAFRAGVTESPAVVAARQQIAAKQQAETQAEKKEQEQQ